ncbi:MAG TPA: response regulator transcription factor [Chryseolinea sp.]|nr:response regulator transcription factor [Chryseolinea sp.]
MPGRKPIRKRFLVVDDHTIVRSALKTLLKDIYSNALVEESVDGSDVIEKIKLNSYDLIIMDIQMPKNEALGLIKQISTNYPSIPVLIYSMASEKIYGIGGLKAGAKGFVSKESPMDELRKAINLAILGKTYLSQDIAELISQQTLTKSETPFSNLSPRELQIVGLLLAGNGVSKISIALGLKNSTIGTHKNHIYQKLNIANLLELKALSDSLLL